MDQECLALCLASVLRGCTYFTFSAHIEAVLAWKPRVSQQDLCVHFHSQELAREVLCVCVCVWAWAKQSCVHIIIPPFLSSPLLNDLRLSDLSVPTFELSTSLSLLHSWMHLPGDQLRWGTRVIGVALVNGWLELWSSTTGIYRCGLDSSLLVSCFSNAWHLRDKRPFPPLCAESCVALCFCGSRLNRCCFSGIKYMFKADGYTVWMWVHTPTCLIFNTMALFYKTRQYSLPSTSCFLCLVVTSVLAISSKKRKKSLQNMSVN